MLIKYLNDLPLVRTSIILLCVGHTRLTAVCHHARLSIMIDDHYSQLATLQLWKPNLSCRGLSLSLTCKPNTLTIHGFYVFHWQFGGSHTRSRKPFGKRFSKQDMTRLLAANRSLIGSLLKGHWMPVFLQLELISTDLKLELISNRRRRLATTWDSNFGGKSLLKPQ